MKKISVKILSAKKISVIIIALVLTVTLCACGEKIIDLASDVPFIKTITDSLSSRPEPTPPKPTVRVTFPEGMTLIEVAQKLEENKVCSASDFMALTTDTEYLATLDYKILEGIDTENTAYYLEGFVFPDTYDFYIGESAENALGRFLSNLDLKITDEHMKRAEELGYTMHEILALASIIQEEASDPVEMPYVSSVLHNRLNSPSYGKLQCDVTIHYVNERITDSPYLEGDTSVFAEHYNTYKCDGLPAGPICNPGLAAIEAALYPADTDYYFFFTDADWNYYYNNDYNTHQKMYNELVKNK